MFLQKTKHKKRKTCNSEHVWEYMLLIFSECWFITKLLLTSPVCQLPLFQGMWDQPVYLNFKNILNSLIKPAIHSMLSPLLQVVSDEPWFAELVSDFKHLSWATWNFTAVCESISHLSLRQKGTLCYLLRESLFSLSSFLG